MIVTAIVAVRNEEAYLGNCLRHLVANGIRFIIIDHQSSDRSADIYGRSEFKQNLVRVEQLPFLGEFSLREQLKLKMAVIENTMTDWIIHLDADEIMHSRGAGESLTQALARLDAEGWNAVNFDEFVFLPIDHDYVPELTGDQPMAFYYYLSRGMPRLMRAWRKADDFSMLEHGGHFLTGRHPLRLAPESLVLRHYIVLSQDHAYEKYVTRRFAPSELAAGWHRAREGKPRDAFRLPPAARLKKLPDAADRDLDRSDPWPAHYWLS